LLIGLIAPPWLPVPPVRYGGIELVIDGLARGLMAAGHEVLLAVPAGSTCPVPQIPGLPAGDAARMGCAVVEIPYALSVYEAMREVDVIHDHTVVGPLCIRPRRETPVITTNHGPFNADLNPIYAEMSCRGVATIAISRHQASTAQNVKIAAIIHHGIDVEDIPVGNGDGGYACALGRMTPNKGIREAILVAREAEVPLRIAAKMREPLERQYFDECVRPLLGGEIEYLGELNAAEKYQLLGGAFALLNPIQWPEPFGLVMIEALACGTPVVATRRASAPEIVTEGETGFLRFELSALAQALTRAPDLRRRRCREKAVTCFSTSRMVAEHLQLYRCLLESGPRDRGGRFLDDVAAVPAPIVRDRGRRQPVLRRATIPSSLRPATVPVQPESVL
jgi:glycosyltransferase involved in cell wall biosynthesis